MHHTSFFIALHLLGGLSFAWSSYSVTTNTLPSLLSLRKSPSSIPQFMLDTEHPWLTTNKAWLSRYPNVTEALCSRDSALWQYPDSPDHAPPADLYKKISLNDEAIPYGGYWEPRAWASINYRLQELAACEAAIAGVEHLHVNAYVSGSGSYPRAEPPPPPGLPGLFADVLAKMHNLSRLDWGFSSEVTRDFEPAFVAKNLMLPTVRHLQPGAGSDYLVSRCPNVEILAAGDYPIHWSWVCSNIHRYELIKSSTGLGNLKEWRLSTGSSFWTLGMLEGILIATPNITSLRMTGPLHAPQEIVEERRAFGYTMFTSTELNQATIKEYLRVLTLFPNLEYLKLPASYDLDMGFDGGHWCGNAYDGPEGRAYGRYVAEEGAETTEIAAKIALKALPRLKHLEIGHEIANLTLNDRGQPDMTWPWTGRMEQFTYDIWEE